MWMSILSSMGLNIRFGNVSQFGESKCRLFLGLLHIHKGRDTYN